MFKKMRTGRKKQTQLIDAEKKSSGRMANGGKLAVSAFTSYGILMLLSAGCMTMFTSVFAQEISVKIVVSDMAVPALFIWGFYFFLPFYGAKITIKPFGGKDGLGRWNIHLVLAVVFYYRYHSVRREIGGGFFLLANEVITKLNEYYGSSIMAFPVEGATNDMAEAAIRFFALLVFWWQAAVFFHRKKMVFALLTGIAVFFLDLLAGYAPGQEALFLFAAGGIGILPFRQNGYVVRKRADQNAVFLMQAKSGLFLIGTFFICIWAAGWFGGRKAETVTEWQEEALAYQHGIESRIMDWRIFDSFRGDDVRVSNRAPEYENREVMGVWTNKRPLDIVYLRGYVGDTYSSGLWSNESRNDFEKAVAAWSAESRAHPETVLFQMPYESLYRNVMGIQVNYKLDYLDDNDDFAYFPYYTNLKSFQRSGDSTGNMYVVADSFFQREQGLEGITVEGISPDSFFAEILYAGLTEEYEMVAEEYESYLTRYLEVPEGLQQIQALGEELNTELEETYGKFLGNQKMQEEGISREGAAVYLARNAIFERTGYSLALSEVPYGEDTIQYFLFGSGKGFCQHYASAGVLLLRKMGIPARYVTGYALQPEDFSLEGGTYQAKVLDSHAHAWVEIYISGIGWVPVEMTEGQSSLWDDMELFVGTRNEVLLLVSQKNNPDMMDMRIYMEQNDSYYSSDLYSQMVSDAIDEYMTEKESQKSQNTAGNAGTEGENEGSNRLHPERNTNSQNTERTEQNEQLKEAAGSAESDHAGNTSSGEKKRKIMNFVGIFVIFLLAAGICIRSYQVYREANLENQAFVQKNYRRFVRSVSGKVYRILKKKGVIRGNRQDDRLYQECVRKQLTMFSEEELKRYFSVTERAAFAGEPITEEDAQFCLNFYKEIKLLKIK